MGDEVIETVESPELRRERRERPDRAMGGEGEDNLIVSFEDDAADGAGGKGGDKGDTAIKEAQRLAEEATRRADEEAQRREAAEREVEEANRRVAQESSRRTTDRKASLLAQNEDAKGSLTTARTAYKAAREAGDLEAELSAVEQIGRAQRMIEATATDLASIETSSDAGGARDDGKGTGGDQRRTEDHRPVIHPASKAWITKNPEFDSDPQFRRMCLDADFQARRDGIVPNTRAYFRYLDEQVSKFKGEGGDRRMSGDDKNGQRRGGEDRARAFDGAPPNRNGGGDGAGFRTIRTALGDVKVMKGASGKTSINIPQSVRADFEEGARIANMSLGDYALEQVKIAQESAAGMDTGLITAEGRKYQ